MKKLLSILGVLSLTSVATTSVVACGGGKDFIQLILPETGNTQWAQFQEVAEKYIADNSELKEKYEVRTLFSEQKPELELSNTKSAVDGGAKAVIIAQRDQNVTVATEYVTSNDIPLVGINIPFNTSTDEKKLPNYWVGQDYTKGSMEMGKTIYKILEKYKKGKNKFNLFEIQGEKPMNGVKERHNGFKLGPNEVVKGAEWNYIGNNGKGEEIYGDWNNEKALKIAGDNSEAILNEKDGADVIYGHNDGMARAAQEAILKAPGGGEEKLTTTFDAEGKIVKLGIIVVGYDYDSITVGMIPKWKENSAKNLFGAIQMSAIEMATKSMKKSIEEIENGNKNKGKNILEALDIIFHMPDGILTKEEQKNSTTK